MITNLDSSSQVGNRSFRPRTLTVTLCCDSNVSFPTIAASSWTPPDSEPLTDPLDTTLAFRLSGTVHAPAFFGVEVRLKVITVLSLPSPSPGPESWALLTLSVSVIFTSHCTT
uniref:Uncharacterized protein n=1 Tax=Branchiostoma floridae TaxID=7739 RepID=C3ZBN3_BRAFL|eukprot:XP_002594259.1 hypothetical protein BRAFLDRAFT_65111 [Branchiostoma floridae]